MPKINWFWPLINTGLKYDAACLQDGGYTALSTTDWARLLYYQPELIDRFEQYCCWDKLSGGDLALLIRNASTYRNTHVHQLTGNRIVLCCEFLLQNNESDMLRFLLRDLTNDQWQILCRHDNKIWLKEWFVFQAEKIKTPDAAKL